MRSAISDDEFVEQYRLHGPQWFVREHNLDATNVGARRRRIERDRGIEIIGPNGAARSGKLRIPAPKGAARLDVKIKDGHIIVASDCHYWPGEKPLLHRALVAACKEYKPKAIILNGDVMDLPSVSRHDPIGWEHWPKVHEEIEWAQDMTHEIATAVGRAEKIWTFGNHDKRFESRLARMAPEYAKINGVHLKDHFPLFEPCWAVLINPGVDQIHVKHRFRGGIHKVYTNILWTGGHTVTGHLHSAEVRGLTFLNERTYWGVDTGCVAEPYARAFESYMEDNPRNWRSAFAILTFKDGRLLCPELVQKFDDKRVQFRGEIFVP